MKVVYFTDAARRTVAKYTLLYISKPVWLSAEQFHLQTLIFLLTLQTTELVIPSWEWPCFECLSESHKFSLDKIKPKVLITSSWTSVRYSTILFLLVVIKLGSQLWAVHVPAHKAYVLSSCPLSFWRASVHRGTQTTPLWSHPGSPLFPGTSQDWTCYCHGESWSCTECQGPQPVS